MFTATRLQAATYLLGVCLFSISFLVFLNASLSFIITDLIQEHHGVGNAVGTLGFADELVALIACPVWGVLSDRIGIRTVCVLGYTIVAVSLFIFVQARNVFPQLLLARLLFSVGASATATMVTAILPSMTVPNSKGQSDKLPAYADHACGHTISPSVSSELTITPARLQVQSQEPLLKPETLSHRSSPTRLAGFVGMFTGFGALLALGLFLPLPTQFQKLHIGPGPAIAYTYYVVGGVALLVAGICYFGLRNLKGEEEKSWRALVSGHNATGVSLENQPMLAYWKLLLKSVKLGFKHPLIGLGYLGGFVARASSVGISLFIPLFVNAYFTSSGICKPINDPTDIKSHCREAYILAAQLSGTSQLVALLMAPVFGYLADRYRRFHIPLLAATFTGVIGYVGFALLRSPESSGERGSPLVFIMVSLLGISQIGCIVCSLGFLGRGISGLEVNENHTYPSPQDLVDIERPYTNDGQFPDGCLHHGAGSLLPQQVSCEETSRDDRETRSLLPGKSPKVQTLNHLKGSIAGVYSLGGGAGILLLTKLGGFLFDTQSPVAPFYMLAIFNALLLGAGLLCGILQSRWAGRVS
ncbi:MAG: hypothetical protein Q9187_000250 [Circinaria calcarea]